MGYAKYALIAAAAMVSATQAQAATTTVSQGALVSDGNFYTNAIGSTTLARNDDGSTGRISLGFNITFFGQTYNSLFINNNGNVTFSGALSQYVPSGPTGVNQPVISAWFGDVDTNGAASGLLHYQLDTPGQLVITWDNVGYFSSKTDKLNSFQMIIRGDTFAVPNGEGNIGFFYKQMPWEATDTSQTAAIGFGDGAGNAVVLQGSNTAGLNAVVQNKHIWFNQNLDAVPPSGVPEPASWAMMILGMGAVGVGLRRKVRQTVTFAKA